MELGMSYDNTFDQTRLNQLASQHLGNSELVGRVLFFASPDDNRLDLATWQFESDEDHEAITGSDFKFEMMELLDILLAYRAQHDQPNVSQGVINIDGPRLSIEWLPKHEVEAMRHNGN
jgi:hypothetical protein